MTGQNDALLWDSLLWEYMKPSETSFPMTGLLVIFIKSHPQGELRLLMHYTPGSWETCSAAGLTLIDVAWTNLMPEKRFESFQKLTFLLNTYSLSFVFTYDDVTIQILICFQVHSDAKVEIHLLKETQWRCQMLWQERKSGEGFEELTTA